MPLADLITMTFESVIKHTLVFINGLRTMAQLEILTAERIFWVITVPAIWDEMSKEIMKYCAKQSGMKYFALGLEPIVSTFYVLNTQGKDFNLRRRNQLLVLDCGGGTIDAACIEITSENNDLSELHYGDGILTGGLKVDQEYLNLMSKLFDKEIINSVKSKQPAQWIRQRQEFVMAKFTVKCDMDDDEHWNVPFCFPINSYLARQRRQHKQKYRRLIRNISKYEIPDHVKINDDGYEPPEKIEEKNENSNDLKTKLISDYAHYDPKYKIGGMIKLGRTNLRIHKKGWVHLHNKVLSDISQFLHRLFEDVRVSQIDHIILVGGFANSEYLKQRLIHDFPRKKFHIPRAPHLAVVKGALHWICNPQKLRRTIAKYSYGIAIDRQFDSNIDSVSRRMFSLDGAAIVQNAFFSLIVRNEEYEEGFENEFQFCIPANSSFIEIFIYASEDPFCRYIFGEDGELQCLIVMKFILELEEVLVEERPFTVTMKYYQSGMKLFYDDPNDQVSKAIDVCMDDVKRRRIVNDDDDRKI